MECEKCNRPAGENELGLCDFHLEEADTERLNDSTGEPVEIEDEELDEPREEPQEPESEAKSGEQSEEASEEKASPVEKANKVKSQVEKAANQAKQTMERVSWAFKGFIALLTNPAFYVTVLVAIALYVVANVALTAYQTLGSTGELKEVSSVAVAAECTPIPGQNGVCYPMTPTGSWSLNTYDGHAAEAKDIPGPEGTPLYAMAAGTVVYSQERAVGDWCPVTPASAFQHELTLKFDTPVEGTSDVRYVHMQEPSPLKVGDKVQGGDFVGMLGNTGCSTGPHLHIEFTNGTGVNLANIIGSLKF